MPYRASSHLMVHGPGQRSRADVPPRGQVRGVSPPPEDELHEDGAEGLRGRPIGCGEHRRVPVAGDLVHDCRLPLRRPLLEGVRPHLQGHLDGCPVQVRAGLRAERPGGGGGSRHVAASVLPHSDDRVHHRGGLGRHRDRGALGQRGPRAGRAHEPRVDDRHGAMRRAASGPARRPIEVDPGGRCLLPKEFLVRLGVLGELVHELPQP
mmetsp:Transcript_11356/g.26945  ORF Transcript_11356/g.26945 Transcript_11356/m.26945 type:complete len:208 (+) Transcript_11356:772-1395(+)